MQESGCQEICGDGVLFSSNHDVCDDGNTVSGDGCSSNCIVEDFYRCTNTDTFSASVCTYLKLGAVLRF